MAKREKGEKIGRYLAYNRWGLEKRRKRRCVGPDKGDRGCIWPKGLKKKTAKYVIDFKTKETNYNRNLDRSCIGRPRKVKVG